MCYKLNIYFSNKRFLLKNFRDVFRGKGVHFEQNAVIVSFGENQSIFNQFHQNQSNKLAHAHAANHLVESFEN